MGSLVGHRRLIEILIQPARLQQLFVRSALADSRVVQNDDLIRMLDGREPVRNDQRRAPLGELFKRMLNVVLGYRVQRAGRFVQNQDRRIFQK